MNLRILWKVHTFSQDKNLCREPRQLIMVINNTLHFLHKVAKLQPAISFPMKRAIACSPSYAQIRAMMM